MCLARACSQAPAELIEGTVASYRGAGWPQGIRSQEFLQVDTRNIPVYRGGAFSGLEKVHP